MTDYIDDPNFDGSVEAVREHYRRAEPVIKALESLGEAPTAGFFGNSGWYKYQRTGRKVTRRATTLEIDEDYLDLVDGLEPNENDSSWRSLYNITSWKDREAVYTPASVPRGEDFEQGAGLAGYADMRGFPLWVDLDLEDNDDGEEGPNWKRQRGDMDEEKLAAVETAQAEFIAEFADLYGVGVDEIAAFDSGGGAYIYGPAASTIPIAERYADDEGPFGDARSLIFREIRERMFAYAAGEAANAAADDYGFEGVESRVFDRVSEAEGLLSPDWMQNRNRQSKAPLSIHGDHDVVATPLRNQDGSVDYRPTLVSEVDTQVVERTAKEAAKITETPGTGAAEDMADSLISSLFPEYADRETCESWSDILDLWLTEERERRRNEAHREAVEKLRQRERLEEQREEIAETVDADPEDVTVDDMIAAIDVTPSRQDVYDALDDRHTVDVREVIREHASDAFNTSDRGHEITFDPSWRKSDSGESCAIPNGENEFIDNKVDSGGGPAFAYAIGKKIVANNKHAAAKTLSGRAWGKALDGLRSEGYNIPVYVPEAGAEKGNGETYDRTPHWAVVKAAVALEITEPENLVEREGEDGSSYQGLVADDYNATLDALESRGIEHGRRRAETEAEPESALPIAQLRALNPQERRRAAGKRGLHIPETEEVQDRVADAIDTAVAEERTTVVEAPTGAGKSYHSSTAPWLAKEEADEAPTLVLTGTKEHRKQNAEKSRQADVTYRQLRGRTEACEVAAGEHDPEAVAEAEEDLQAVTIDGTPASQWFDAQCEGKGLPFSVAHKYAEKNNDQGVRLPCHDEGEECLAIAQWDGIPRTEEGDPAADVIHATHQFAMVPSLRMHTNLLFDELPDFTIDVGEHGLSHDRIHRMVAAYLDEVDARVTTWEAFVSMANAPGDTDAGAEAEQLERTIQNEHPGVEWYFDEQDAHTIAPALTRGIWFALKDEADANGRRMATVSHEPPRLDKNANDDEGWNREWLRVVLDEQNRVVKLWDTPDLSQARSVVGLDARPAMPRWRLNVDPGVDRTKVLDTEERALWRHFEQGKTVVQVGDATRPYTSGEYFDRQGTTALLEHLTEEHGDVPVITAGSVEHEHRDILEELGVDEPKTMHYGEEKSREDFAEEDTLLVNGVIDPGDDLVLDLLAALDADATPETTENDDGEEVRAHGRGFDGEDADTAEAILESVRANHVAQAVGRSGRNPDSDERSVVYVRTDVAPPDLVDYKTPGVQWPYREKQREIIAHVRENPGVSAREVAENTSATKEHVRNTLQKLEEDGLLSVREGAGAYGADLHRLDAATPENGVADTEIANWGVWEHYTCYLAIDAVHLDGGGSTPAPEAAEAGPNTQLVQFGVEPPS